jgi:hypothetical protein
VTVFYVSPLGDDTSSGVSPHAALATLGAAIKAMATDGTSDTTYILDGTYYLNGKDLSLTSANSNDTIAAYPGANPVISGGTPVPASGWTVGSNGIWSIQVDASDVEQLAVDGQSQTLARYPNEVPTNSIQGASGTPAMCFFKRDVVPRIQSSCCVSGVRGAGVIEPQASPTRSQSRPPQRRPARHSP